MGTEEAYGIILGIYEDKELKEKSDMLLEVLRVGKAGVAGLENYIYNGRLETLSIIEYLTPEIADEIKKYRTRIPLLLFGSKNLYPSQIEYMKYFNIPGEMTIHEWFIMINKVTESYMFNHKQEWLDVIEKIRISPYSLIAILPSHFTRTIEHGWSGEATGIVDAYKNMVNEIDMSIKNRI